MKTYKYLLCLLFGGMLFVSCSDFLDKPPIDQFIDEEFWQNEKQARTFMYDVYPTLFPGYETGTTVPSWINDAADDAVSGGDQSAFQPDTVPATDDLWRFVNIRRANYVIENAPRMNESQETINHWLGIGYFLRGYFYSSLTFQYGDVPYFDRVLQYSKNKEDEAYIYKDRDPRDFVVDKIIQDFELAMENVRVNDGPLQINRYVVAAFVSRYMLREGTFQKYYYQNNTVATKCLQLAKKASELVMAGPYSIASNYKTLFTSSDLSSNPEVIIYRKYLDGILAHSMVQYNISQPQGGISKSLAESFLRSDGFPIYYENEYWLARTAEAFFADRDPRLSYNFRPKYYPQGANNTPFAYSLSGYSWRKYTDDTWMEEGNPMKNSPFLNGGRNITNAPCLRLGEVLLNYAEICYELESITGEDVFNQGVLDKTINKLRDRAGMPHLQEINGKPAVGGQDYDDPRRTQWEDNDVSPMLWELRRERRVELCLEGGLRSVDLKRWKKLDYLSNAHNPDFRYGAYICLSDFPADVNKNVKLANKIDPVSVDTLDGKLTEGYIIKNIGRIRPLPQDKNYIKPVPENERTLYETKGYTLTQTKGWEKNN